MSFRLLIAATMREVALLPKAQPGSNMDVMQGGRQVSCMPDRNISSRQRHIASRVFGGPVAWRSLPEGTVNETWKIHASDGRTAIVRVGPSVADIEQGPSWLRANALGCEQELLALVRPHLACVPATIAAGFLPGDRPWVVQELVSGIPLSQVTSELTAEESTKIWRQVGSLVRRVHEIPAPWFGTPDGRDRFSSWPAMVTHDVEGLLRDARRWDLPREPFDTLAALVQRHGDALAEITQPGVVHSDLDPRHVFVEECSDGWRISGMIDWEYGRFADPLSESLLVELLQRPEQDPERMAFLAGYWVSPEILRGAAAIRRQAIYRGIATCWALTDAARLSGTQGAQ